MSPSGVGFVIPVALGSLPSRRSRLTRLADAEPLIHCLRAMLEPSRRFEAVIVAVAEAHWADVRSVLAGQELAEVRLVVAKEPGSRAACLRAALTALPATSASVVVHDLARPLVSDAVRNRVIDALAAGSTVVVPTLTMVDSVKRVDARGTVVSTYDRTLLRSVQFPRGFRSADLAAALRRAPSGAVFDELAEPLGRGATVITVVGDPDGFELRDRDLSLAEAILACRLAGRR